MSVIALRNEEEQQFLVTIQFGFFEEVSTYIVKLRRKHIFLIGAFSTCLRIHGQLRGPYNGYIFSDKTCAYVLYIYVMPELLGHIRVVCKICLLQHYLVIFYLIKIYQQEISKKYSSTFLQTGGKTHVRTAVSIQIDK